MTRKPQRQVHNDDSVSLNKYISDSGFCSRREADDYIETGRAFINDKTAEKGNRVQPGDVVTIDGEPLRKKAATIYIACNKPRGITTTTDTKDKTNIITYLNYKQRIFPIGRLDKDSEGLLFLTNDGNIVNKILRAGNAHEKEYVVTVDKPLTQEVIQNMAAGVRILGEQTLPCKVKMEGKSTFRITLVQGLNRQIRRMCEALGYKVMKLVRVRIMNVNLAGLASGHFRYLTADEISGIHALVADSGNGEEVSRSVPVARPARVAKAAPASIPKKKVAVAWDEKPKKRNKKFVDYRKGKR